MLKLVQYEKETQKLLERREYRPDAHIHHQYLIDEYIKSHRIRNHSPKTIKKIRPSLIHGLKTMGIIFALFLFGRRWKQELADRE
ncbi:MAG: hypothetical protein A2504_05960 [Bdellovibrionales bacterium RIFOXYD12_FULL_39_22]|nr:MAG: hypothetical protein A2385_08280 [Bdellovibrionales bacterium RIFOXYB1_FULL_39_21]OFZ45300.1 MAG: hypothetical protein A2485_06260 [Bdellovibrionales bacterium RIFOXYC12_FULL_39_17]OFZ45511.1 MAG: hypothetical protein A2404_02860 [Bdellovibrionales bacterium RIFOXYC1_FULL_39_130]OFZ73733.1 MAG: hypothetical protein A2451_14850 [Bdellovibrionales bacterium RIFOXYC2_FULL_39_8]OFZ77372.1 MAG: hypothetical protein A2560_08450 [Bdellovibrionales bacterium RIFOXYD1_FULL_39_84]OFZ91501.1 MAG: